MTAIETKKTSCLKIYKAYRWRTGTKWKQLTFLGSHQVWQHILNYTYFLQAFLCENTKLFFGENLSKFLPENPQQQKTEFKLGEPFETRMSWNSTDMKFAMLFLSRIFRMLYKIAENSTELYRILYHRIALNSAVVHVMEFHENGNGSSDLQLQCDT
jgi:hypothetical protein